MAAMFSEGGPAVTFAVAYSKSKYATLTPRWIRVLAMIERDPRTGCWLWQGPTDEKGYGRTFFGRRSDGTRHSLRVHRVAYEEWIGPIPDGMQLDHLCEVTQCCNPWHLRPTSNALNQAARSARMAWCRRGHPRTPENIRPNGAGGLQCLRCIEVLREERKSK